MKLNYYCLFFVLLFTYSCKNTSGENSEVEMNSPVNGNEESSHEEYLASSNDRIDSFQNIVAPLLTDADDMLFFLFDENGCYLCLDQQLLFMKSIRNLQFGQLVVLGKFNTNRSFESFKSSNHSIKVEKLDSRYFNKIVSDLPIYIKYTTETGIESIFHPDVARPDLTLDFFKRNDILTKQVD